MSNIQVWNYSGVRDFLKKTGVLASNDPEVLNKAKKEYWKAYKVYHKQQSRAAFPEFTVRFSKAQAKQLSKVALQNDNTPQEYITNLVKDALDAPVEQLTLVSKEVLMKISEVYDCINDYVRNVCRDDDLKDVYQNILERIEILEDLVNAEVWL